MPDPQALLRLAQRHNGCPETGRPCGEPAGCGCGMEAAVEREDDGMDVKKPNTLWAVVPLFLILTAVPVCDMIWPHGWWLR